MLQKTGDKLIFDFMNKIFSHFADTASIAAVNSIGREPSAGALAIQVQRQSQAVFRIVVFSETLVGYEPERFIQIPGGGVGFPNFQVNDA
jgi:hypothetical protein